MTGRGGGAGRVRGTTARGAARGWRTGAPGLAVVLLLGGCGTAAEPGSSATGASSSGAGSVVWPVAELTELVPASGPGTPPSEAELQDLTSFADQDGRPLEEVVAIYQHQDDFSAFVERVRATFPGSFSDTSFTGPDGDPAWVAFTGAVPVQARALAAGLPLDVELRGGAALTEAERDAATPAGVDAFASDAASGEGWSGGLDATTGRFTFQYVPEGDEVPGEATTAAVIAAARAAIGRDAPFSVVYAPDETDPASTTPAVWFLPAGFVADQSATTVEVLVDEQGCTSGRGAAGNTADPEVEVTATEVRIAISTLVRRGAQSCQGHPLAPVVVDLGGPLGDRVLVDVHGDVDDDLLPPEERWGDLVVPAAAPEPLG